SIFAAGERSFATPASLLNPTTAVGGRGCSTTTALQRERGKTQMNIGRSSRRFASANEGHPNMKFFCSRGRGRGLFVSRLTVFLTRPRARAFRSRCPHQRKRESQHHVPAEKLGVADCVAGCVWLTIQKSPEWQCFGKVALCWSASATMPQFAAKADQIG